MQDFQIGLHDLIQVMNLHAARQQRSHGVAKEVHGFFVFGEGRMALEQGALFGFVEVGFECRDAVLAGGAEEVVQKAQGIQVSGRAVYGLPLNTARRLVMIDFRM